jgi:hypothetical protein
MHKFNFMYTHEKIMAFSVPSFMKDKSSIALCTDLLYQISPKLDIKRARYTQKSIYAH